MTEERFIGRGQKIALRPGDTLAAAGESPALPVWIHLVPIGAWEGHHTVPNLTITEADCVAIVANSRAWEKPIPLDFEHQTEHALTNGRPAPATGWIVELEVRADGVWGRVEWLEPGASMVKARTYRFVSPVIRWQGRDRVTGARIGPRLTSVALTNVPFFAGLLTPLVANANPGVFMSLLMTGLIAALGLSADSTEQAVLDAALEKINKPPEKPETPLTARFGEQVLGVLGWSKPPPNAAETIGKAMSKDKALATDLAAAKEEVATLRAEIITLKAGKASNDIEQLVLTARAEGRLTPKLEPEVRELAALNFGAAQRLVANLPVLTARQVSTPADPAAVAAANRDLLIASLTPEEVAHCEKYGGDKAAFAQQKAADKKRGEG